MQDVGLIAAIAITMFYVIAIVLQIIMNFHQDGKKPKESFSGIRNCFLTEELYWEYMSNPKFLTAGKKDILYTEINLGKKS